MILSSKPNWSGLLFGSGANNGINLIGCKFECVGEIFKLCFYTDEIYINNCLFMNCEVWTGGNYSFERSDFYFCTFVECKMETGNYYPADIRFSILDDRCERGGQGQVFSHCRVPPEYPPSANDMASTFDPPMFVHGPLGAYYLSNEASGQERTSSCVSWVEEWYVWTWPWDPPSTGTTRTDGVPDEGQWFDIGYHYPSVAPPPPAVSVRTDRAEYAAGEEMLAYMTYENRGVKVEGAIYFAFGPESLDWLIYWPWMTFVPTPWVEGTLYSGISHPNLPPTTHTIPEGLAPGVYFWLGAVIACDGAFASDIALWPVTITGP